jgi:GNAT superfamily N-acetyltransferase
MHFGPAEPFFPSLCRIYRGDEESQRRALFWPLGNHSAICFVALWQNIPVAFSAWLPLRSGTVSNGYREHRTVTLPDFQGVGIGNALSACCASMWRGLGKRVFSATSHPSMISTRERSPLWRVTRSIQLGVRDRDSRMKHAMNRMTAGFEYIGEMMPPKQAQ